MKSERKSQKSSRRSAKPSERKLIQEPSPDDRQLLADKESSDDDKQVPVPANHYKQSNFNSIEGANSTWQRLQRQNSHPSEDADSYNDRKQKAQGFQLRQSRVVKEENSDFSDDEPLESRMSVYRAIPKRYGEEDAPTHYEHRKTEFKFDPNLLDKVKRLEEDIKSDVESADETKDEDAFQTTQEVDRYDPFKYTHFTSFRKHKLIEEDYKLLTVDDPEQTTDVKNDNFFTQQKILQEAIEVVPISTNDLEAQDSKNK